MGAVNTWSAILWNWRLPGGLVGCWERGGKSFENVWAIDPDYQIIRVFNPFMPDGISNRYQLEQSISILKDAGWYFSFYSNFKINCKQTVENLIRRRISHFAASDLVLHSLSMSHKKDARLILINCIFYEALTAWQTYRDHVSCIASSSGSIRVIVLCVISGVVHFLSA